MLTGEDKEIFDISQTFNFTKSLLVAVKGFDKESLKKLNKLKKELSSNPNIEINNQLNNKNLSNFKQQYSFYLNELNYLNAKNLNVKEKLKVIYTDLISNPMFFTVNQNDPLNIVKENKITKKMNIKNGNLILENYGYLAVLSINAKTDGKSRRKVYDEIQEVLKPMEGIRYFSRIFFYVENSQIIKDDIRIIIMSSMFILGLLYILILRNVYLFINIMATLISSVIVGQIITSLLFVEISVIAIAFSTAITSVSIDYMFHHYLHNYYNKRLGFNKTVFYGFLTTITAFILISFINFPLIKQISYFSIISLLTAYLHFAFLYPHLKIKHKEPYVKENFNPLFSIKSHYLIIFSITIVLFSLAFLKYDFDLANLDYDNVELKKEKKFFTNALKKDQNVVILIKANDISTLIHNSKIIKTIDTESIVPLASLVSYEQYIVTKQKIKSFGFEQIKNNIKQDSISVGFRANYFDSSYAPEKLYASYPKYTSKMIKTFGYDLSYINGEYIAYAMLTSKHVDKILELNFVQDARTRILFKNSLKKVIGELLLFGGVTLFLIIMILALVTKKRFLQALTYILFPASLIIIYGFFVPLNIMHIFMAFIVLAIGIDYGIYMNEDDLSHNTTLAIIYSLVSTFAGFGVLTISNINSLFSIGVAAVIGVFGILFLLLFQKRRIKLIQ
jgi:predicted RND superfamily exporter protein